ncbi:MAG: tail fiber domain-containing protein [Polaribacter sp.]
MKANKSILIILFFFSIISYSQVGIGTTTPVAQLEVKASNVTTPTNKDGILIPRIDNFPTTNPTAAQNGMIVFLNGTGIGKNKFYYWEQATTSWIPFVREIDDLRDGKSKDLKSIFLGVNAGSSFTGSGTDLIGIGNNALQSIVVGGSSGGTFNLALGNDALQLVTTGDSNIAIGTNALKNNVSGNQNIAIGTDSQMNTNARPYNISIGFESMKDNVSGGENTALGSNSLKNNTDGDFNVALGTTTLFSNIDGDNNLAVGSKSLRNKTTGDGDVAVGSNALLNSTSSANNVSIGTNSMLNFGSGNNNTAIGSQSLMGNGSSSFSSTANVAVGYRALFKNSIGINNTAIGFNAFRDNTVNNNNVGIGYSACLTCTNAINTTVIGANASADGTNSTAIGYQASVTANNTIHLGNASITKISGQVSFTPFSDKRIKDNVKENVVGLDFIKRLRPVTYNLNVDKQNSIMGITETSSDKNKYESEKIRRTGFIAQEVEIAAKKVGYNFSGVSKPKNSKDLYGLSYAEFVVPLVKAAQEQSLVIEDLLEKVKVLTKRIEELEKNKK